MPYYPKSSHKTFFQPNNKKIPQQRDTFSSPIFIPAATSKYPLPSPPLPPPQSPQLLLPPSGHVNENNTSIERTSLSSTSSSSSSNDDCDDDRPIGFIAEWINAYVYLARK